MRDGDRDIERPSPPTPPERQALRERDAAHGRNAVQPSQIPWRGWVDVAVRVARLLRETHATVVAAGIAFFTLFATIPAAAALVAAFGMLGDPAALAERLDPLADVLTGQALGFFQDRLREFAHASGGVLGASAFGTAVVALWSGMRAARAVTVAVNLCYREEDSRTLARRIAASFVFTLCLFAFVLAALLIVAVVPFVLDQLAHEAPLAAAVGGLRWPALVLVTMLALAALYRYLPDRAVPRWRWASPGAILATTVWVAASAGFSLLVAWSERSGPAYGSLGTVLTTMGRVFAGAWAVLLGAATNGELERQTRADTRDPDARQPADTAIATTEETDRSRPDRPPPVRAMPAAQRRGARPAGSGTVIPFRSAPSSARPRPPPARPDPSTGRP